MPDSLVVLNKDSDTVSYVDPETGETVDRISSEHGTNDDGFRQAVQVIDGLLLVGHRDGTVTAHGDDGTERWRYDGAARAAGFATLTGQDGDRIGVLDQRGVYAEIDPETGERYRELLVADGVGGDRCGLRPSREQFAGLTGMPSTGTRSIAVTRRRGVHIYYLPARERE